MDDEETAWKYSFYTIILDGMTWGSTTDTTKYPYIIDTATTMMHIPPSKLHFHFLRRWR